MIDRPTDDRLRRIFGPDTLELLDAYVRDRVQAALDERDAERRWLTVRAAAVYLGVTEKAVRHRIERGGIAYTRQGKTILVDRRALDGKLVSRLRNDCPSG